MSKLDERSTKILWAIIQSHIDLNIPVGSLMITRRFSFGLSSATIRNIMATLEKLGYITQPHTSAGRVPTEKGYRFYVNSLLKEYTGNAESTLSHELSERFRALERENQILIKEAAKTLSSFSHYLAIAIPPKLDDIVLNRIKFIKYENRKVLTILISEERVVKNKIIELDRAHTQKQLDAAADYINRQFSGMTIKKVKEHIAFQLYKEKIVCNELITNLLFLCNNMVASETGHFAYSELSGTSNLPDFATMTQIKGILKAIEDKNFMLKLLNHISESRGPQVFVGMGNILPVMNELSMVVSTYVNQKYFSGASGAIGIIGPTRMNYKKVIPFVDYTAKALTQILSEI